MSQLPFHTWLNNPAEIEYARFELSGQYIMEPDIVHIHNYHTHPPLSSINIRPTMEDDLFSLEIERVITSKLAITSHYDYSTDKGVFNRLIDYDMNKLKGKLVLKSKKEHGLEEYLVSIVKPGHIASYKDPGTGIESLTSSFIIENFGFEFPSIQLISSTIVIDNAVLRDRWDLINEEEL